MPKLTQAERAILINQYRIRAALAEDDSAFDEVITILDRGYECEYEEWLPGFSEPLEKEETDFVYDIMFLYYLLKLAFNREAVENPGGDRDETGALRMVDLEPKFPGFNGNNESELLSYAQYLVSHDKYTEHNHYLNSHGREPRYEGMLMQWTEMGRPTEMTREEAQSILDAG